MNLFMKKHCVMSYIFGEFNFHGNVVLRYHLKVHYSEPICVLDILVENKVIIDLKAKESIADIDRSKLLTYLRLSNKRLGLIINFHVQQLRFGIERIVNKLSE